MVDGTDFETRLEARLRARAALAARPFDAVAIAHEAVATGTRGRWLGRLDWPSRPRGYAWVIVVLLLALALLGAVTLAGALLPKAPVVPFQGASEGWVAFGYGSPGERSGDSDIYIVQEGTAERRIIGSGNDGLRQVCPSFSPDGTRLAYSERPATDNGGNSTVPGAVVIVTLDDAGLPVGPGLRLPAPASSYGDVCPKWAPDGQGIAFLVNGQEPQLWIGHLDGTETQVAAGSPPVSVDGFRGQFDWSPDGSAIVVVGGLSTSLRIVPLDGGQPRLLASAGPSGDFASPRWSPDGTRIAVMAGSSVEIYRADGSASPIDLPGVSSPAWSPDGQQLAFIRPTTSPTGLREDDLVTVSPDGAAARVVVSDPGGIRGVVWSPDGTRLVYADLANPDPSSGALVSVAAVGDADPLVLTQQAYDLEDSDSNNLSWQPVVTPRRSPPPTARESAVVLVDGHTPGTVVLSVGDKGAGGFVTCQSTGDGQLSVGFESDDTFSLVFRANRTVSSLSGTYRGVVWKVTQDPQGTLNADKSGTFSGKDAISGADVSGAFACP